MPSYSCPRCDEYPMSAEETGAHLRECTGRPKRRVWLLWYFDRLDDCPIVHGVYASEQTAVAERDKLKPDPEPRWPEVSVEEREVFE